jgi:hypothetical protein
MKIDMKRDTKIPSKTAMLFALSLFFLMTAKTPAGSLPLASLVEIAEVKNVGLSAGNDSKSIIQAQWSVNAQPGTNIKSFELTLEVTYADGAIERFRVTASGADRKARFEVPTLHVSAGRPGAELRSFKTNITANFTETVTKQGNF